MNTEEIKNAVSEAKDKLADLEARLEESERKDQEAAVRYGTGSTFELGRSNQQYMMVQSGRHKFCLVGLKDGNRWNNAVEVSKGRAKCTKGFTLAEIKQHMTRGDVHVVPVRVV